MARFDGVDFYDIDGLLTEEEVAIRDSVREWVEERVIPVIEGHCRAGTFPMELAREMGEMGFLGANLAGYGCPGLKRCTASLPGADEETGIRSFATFKGRS